MFTYYADGHLKDITDWSGRKCGFAYSGNDLTAKTDPLNQTVAYTYQTGHLLHEVIQPLQRNGQAVKTAFSYYRDGRVFDYRDALGHGETLDYDLYRKSTRVTDPNGGIREYDYDADGRMTKLAEADGARLLFENQGDAIRSKKYDALGYATSFHTAAGPCAVIGKPKDLRISALNGAANVLLKAFCWNADGTLHSQTEYIDPADATRQRVTTYTYQSGSNGLNVSDTNVSGAGQTLHTAYTYDALGRTKTETRYRRASPTDATLLALTTAYAYDALDRPVKATDPQGKIHETVYDANGQTTQEKTSYPTATARAGCAAPAGGYVVCTEATHQYDAADRRINTTDILGNVTRYQYDAAGNLTQATNANGHATRYEYDAMNRRTAVIDANGHRTTTKYNLRGEAVSATNPNGETAKSEHDALGRTTKTTDPLGSETRYQYDANGSLTCRVDANAVAGLQPTNADGCTESRQYDELNRLTKAKDAQGNLTATTYDLLGNRTSITDAASHATAFNYDDLGRLVETVDPLVETPTDKTVKYQYDEAGNLTQETDRKGQVTRHSYDTLNRKTRSDHLADNSFETYSYDGFGDLTQVQNGAVAYTYTYTSKHQLKSKADSRLNKTLSWTYDAAGNPKTKTDYQGDTTTYQYDLTNRLAAETNPAYLQVSYHYDGAGRLIDRILSNGARTRYGWDQAGRLIQLTNSTVTGQAVNNTSYTRDRIGNVLTQSETAGTGQPAGTTNYSYDPEYRLLTADYPGTANDEAYTYDHVGNRKTATKGALVANAATRYYAYDAGNRLQTIRIGSAAGTIESSYTYDANGSLLAETGPRAKTITWNAQNRPSQINSNTFAYDPSGYRIQKADSQGTRLYLLEGEHLEVVYRRRSIRPLNANNLSLNAGWKPPILRPYWVPRKTGYVHASTGSART